MWKMSTPQKSLFSLLSLCQIFLQSVEIWQSSDKNNFAQFFWDTVYAKEFTFTQNLQSSLSMIWIDHRDGKRTNVLVLQGNEWQSINQCSTATNITNRTYADSETAYKIWLLCWQWHNALVKCPHSLQFPSFAYSPFLPYVTHSVF